MNKFNKLYNLILESILTEDINSKIKKAIDTLIKSGQLKDQDDPKAQLVKTIIKRNNSIDINGKTKLSDLLKANQKYIKREQNKDIDLDSIPQFSQKKEYPNGVVIYKVQDTKAGLMVVRKIVDIQWGKNANPWCLIARNANQMGMGEDQDQDEDQIDESIIKESIDTTWDPVLTPAWDLWKRYSAYPKHIAFQNGKLIAFCADDKGNCTWWDRLDKKSKKLKLLDGSYMQTETYKWDSEQRKKNFVKENKLIFNQQTKKYDCNQSIRIDKDNLVDGKFPVPFGVIKGDFDCKYIGLHSLQGAPQKVEGFFDCNNNYELSSLVGGPKYVGKYYQCDNCDLSNLKGIADHIGEPFICFNQKHKLTITDQERKKYEIIDNSKDYWTWARAGGRKF